MVVNVIVNPSQQGISPSQLIERIGQTRTVVLDSRRGWISSFNELRWELGTLDNCIAKFVRLRSLSERIDLTNSIFAGPVGNIIVFSDMDDENILRSSIECVVPEKILNGKIQFAGTLNDFGSFQEVAPVVSPSDSSDYQCGSIGILLVHIGTYEMSRNCIESLQKTSYSGKSIYLLDNASDDLSALRLFIEFPDIYFLVSTARVSYTSSFNLLADLAIRRGAKYIFVSNNDTRGHSVNIFESLISNAHGEVGIVSPVIFDFENNLLRDGPVSHFGVSCPHATEAYLIESNIWEQINGFTNDFNIYCEDIDLIIRLRALGLDGKYDLNVRLEHLQNGTTGSRVFLRTYFYMRNIIWIQKTRPKGSAISVAYFIAQESIQTFRNAWKSAVRGDLYPLFAGAIYALSGILVGILTFPQVNSREDLASALRRKRTQIRFRIR